MLFLTVCEKMIGTDGVNEICLDTNSFPFVNLSSPVIDSNSEDFPHNGKPIKACFSPFITSKVTSARVSSFPSQEKLAASILISTELSVGGFGTVFELVLGDCLATKN